MSKYNISYTEKALSDLDDIYNYVAENLKESQIAFDKGNRHFVFYGGIISFLY